MKKVLLLLVAFWATLSVCAAETGSEQAPLSVSEVLAQGTPAEAVPNTYVKGYIVGDLAKVFGVYQPEWTVPAAQVTNMLLADAPDVRDISKCVPVQLPKGEIRDAISPYKIGNLGKQIIVRGSHEAYTLGETYNGIKGTDWYKFVEAEGPDTPDVPDDKTVISIFESLSEDAWTMDPYWTEEVITMPSSMNYVWYWKSYNGANFMNGTGHIGDVDNAVKSYLVSKSAFNLTGYESVEVEFEHAAKFQTTLRDLCKFVVREAGSDQWQELAIPVWPEAGTWTFVKSGKIDLSAFIGKTIQVAFLYQSTTEGADTWEVKNLKMTGKVDGSKLKPAGLAWSATEAKAILGEAFEAPELSFSTTAPIYYSSSNPSVASVNSEGRISTFAEGETEIKAYSAANGEYEAGEAVYHLVVEASENQPVVFNLLLDYDSPECDWTFENKVLPEELTFVWSWKEYGGAYYLNGSAYKGGPFEAEAYAVSPVISLAGYKDITVSFEHAAKFQTNLAMLSSFLVREAGTTEWTELRIANWPEPGSWAFVNSGKADISAFDGKNIQLAFQYGSNEYGADTWEVRNVRLSGVPAPSDSIDAVEADDIDAEPVYYDLSGRRVSGTPAAGIYIKVRGSKVEKVLMR